MAPSPVSEETLDTHDIQGLVVRGYGKLEAAEFVLLEVADAQRAREYLRGLAGRINLASVSPETSALQVAFTAAGLAKLGMPERVLHSFSREFREGMDHEIRAEALGDRDDNDPKHWEWGTAARPVHMLLMVYALKKEILDPLLDEELEASKHGFTVLHRKQTITLADQKEHFGWRDGLSMPLIQGVPRERPKKKDQEWWTKPIKPGEFVLGYRNEYGAFTECPTIDPVDDPADQLPFDHDGARKSLGRNGTYLVFREMTQKVLEFWDYLEKQSREPGEDPVQRAIVLGTKMVGRWPGGAPLITSPDKDRPERATDNEFLYGKDLNGVSCPHGAHIRRANPRDVLAVLDRGSEASTMMVKKHQMVRRGRAFGRPVVKTMDPGEILAARGKPDNERRGLHFICLVGNIFRQFEFVQRAWIHSANFDSMFKDGDPISAGRRPPGDENPNDEFTCPAEPVRRKYKAMPQFTQLVGGGYFFLPGIAALRFIARQP